MKVSSGDTSSGYTNAAYSSKGVSGLASGIDTESVVQSMLSGVQNKIDKQKQNQQILEWKQEGYRDVIKKVNDFSSKYFSLTSDSSIRLASLYSTAKAESSSDAVSVTTSNSTVEGSFNVQVARLASKTSVSSNGSVSSNSISVGNTDKANAFKFSRSVKLTIGEGDSAVPTDDIDLEGVETVEEAVNKINEAYRAAGSANNIVSINQKVTVKDSDGKALTQKFKLGGVDYTGNVHITTTKGEDGKVTASYKDENGNDLEVSYEKSDGTAYTGEITVSEDVSSTMIFSTNDKFSISGSAAGMAILGMRGTVSSSAAKDDQGDEIPNMYEVKSSGFNANFAKVGSANGSIDITLDGVKKSFTINEGESMDDLAKKVTKAFGSTVSFTKKDDGTYDISVSGAGRQLSISANADTMEAIGFDKGTTSISTRISRSDALSKLGLNSEAETDDDGNFSFTLNGTEIKYTAEDSINSIMNKINSSDAGVKMSYNSLSDKFSLQSTSTGSGFDIAIEGDDEGLFSKLGFKVNDGTLDSSTVKKGENAVVNINGVTVERATNDFTYNGMTLTLNSTTGSYTQNPDDGSFATNADGTLASAGTENKAKISTSRNVDKIVDTLKSFVEDYNTLIADLNGKTHEKAEYKKYPPLTEAQKKEMTDKEIELWEEKSKTGLFHNDKDISSLLSDMRSAMYTKGDSKYILASIGINSSSEWSDYGKLSINEDQLRNALVNNANEVAKLFTGDKGLATRLKKACEDCANTSSASPGALVQIAGVEGKGTEKDNEIYDELEAIKKKLETLNKTYETRKTRYWDTFNKMEEAISKMNSQSDQLSSYGFM